MVDNTNTKPLTQGHQHDNFPDFSNYALRVPTNAK